MVGRFRYEMGDDSPKSSRSDDRLGHAAFADRVANVIVSVDATNGYVLGLNGAWGSGKSTTLNFVIDSVREHNRQRPQSTVLHVDFRPWLITGHQDLVGAFFKVLAENLGDSKKPAAWLVAKGSQPSGFGGCADCGSYSRGGVRRTVCRRCGESRG